MAISSERFKLLVVLFWLGGSIVAGAVLPEGRVSATAGDVRISENGTAAAVAHAGASLHDAAVETGRKSRAEITFADRTVVRIGDNSGIAFESASRNLNLASGALLIQVPTGVGGTQLQVRNITAAATGTTLLAECLPKAYVKFIALTGTSRLRLKTEGSSSDSVLLRPGQMLIAAPDAKALPDAVDVDLSRLIATCQLITNFQPLPNHGRIVEAAANQRDLKSRGNLVDSGLAIFGRGTLVSRGANDKRQSNASASSSAKRKPPLPQ